MSTLQSKIEQFVGSVGNSDYINDWLRSASRFIGRIIPKEELRPYSSNATLDAVTETVSVKDKRVLEIMGVSGPVMVGDPNLKARYKDSGSIFRATNTNPVVIQDGDNIELVDGIGEVKVEYFSYPSPSYSDSSIGNIPPHAEHGIILYSSLLGLNYKLSVALNNLENADLTLPSTPTPPEAPSFTYITATGTTLSATDISVVGTLGEYNKPSSEADFTNLNTYISSEEDLEKAQAELGQQEAKVKAFQYNLYNELNKFNADAKNYEFALQEAIERARLIQERLRDDASRQDNIELANRAKELERQVSEYSNKLQRYYDEVLSYQAEVNASVQKYTTDIQKYIQAINYYATLYKEIVSQLGMVIEEIRG